MSVRDDLELARQLVDTADTISMAHADGAGQHISWKNDGSPVTDGDVAVEKAIRETLGRERPDDQVIGEELGGGSETGRRWVIDPIDGTRSYMRGDLHWCTMIALMDDDQVEVGMISAPILGRRWWATRGGGSWRTVGTADPIRCTAATTTRLADARVEYSELVVGDHEFGDRLDPGLVTLLRGSRHIAGGTGYLSHMMVAQGGLDAMVDNNDNLGLWDVAAISVIVSEAGGAFGHIDGRRTPYGGGAVSATAALLPLVVTTMGTGRKGEHM